MLKEKIQQDTIQSLKNKDSERVSVLRLLTSAIKNEEIEKGSELSDEDVVSLIKKQVKQLRDALKMFKDGGRDDLAKQNEFQMGIMNEYLPAEMSDQDLSEAIDALIAENKALFDSNPNAIIGKAMGKLKAEADPSRIMAELKKRMK